MTAELAVLSQSMRSKSKELKEDAGQCQKRAIPTLNRIIGLFRGEVQVFFQEESAMK
jgi:hypothetical protein